MSKQTKRLKYKFGAFRLDTEGRLLFCGDKVVPLPSKAFDALVVLVENSGHIITKEELIQKIWPDSIDDATLLTQHIFMLRKALGERAPGDRFIEVFPKRGYRFVAPVLPLSERERLARSIRGKYAHIRTSSESFAQLKQEEIKLEDHRR